MWKLVSIFLFSFLLYGQDLEVRLQTRADVKPLYLSRLHTDPSQFDWRYFEELRNVLEFDLNASGFCSVFPLRDDLEGTLHFPEPRADFNLSVWKKEKIPFVLAVEVFQNRLSLTAFQIERESSKKYPDFLLTGRIEEDRRQLHRLADAVQKDLFGIEGISSLRIIYSQRTKNFELEGIDWLSEIWISDADGFNSKQLTHEKNYCLSPGFLPKTNPKVELEFFYVSDRIGQTKIYCASLSNPEGELMVSLRGNQALPAVSRKGTQIAFVTDVAGRPDLFVQNLDSKGKMVGKARQIYSCPRATQASPTYSPDGKQVAFVSDKDGPPRIYLLDVIGPKETQKPHPRLLTRKNRENTSPAWSPDGKKLAYSAKVDGVRQIWLYDFQTQEEIQLTTGPEVKENPAWAPDSFHLIYNTENESTSELYLIDLNRLEPVQISKGPGQKRFASWEPR